MQGGGAWRGRLLVPLGVVVHVQVGLRYHQVPGARCQGRDRGGSSMGVGGWSALLCSALCLLSVVESPLSVLAGDLVWNPGLVKTMDSTPGQLGHPTLVTFERDKLGNKGQVDILPKHSVTANRINDTAASGRICWGFQDTTILRIEYRRAS